MCLYCICISNTYNTKYNFQNNVKNNKKKLYLLSGIFNAKKSDTKNVENINHTIMQNVKHLYYIIILIYHNKL